MKKYLSYIHVGSSWNIYCFLWVCSNQMWRIFSEYILQKLNRNLEVFLSFNHFLQLSPKPWDRYIPKVSEGLNKK